MKRSMCWIELLARFRFRIEQDVIFEAEDIGVRLDTSLRIQKERVATSARRQLLHVISAHGVQQARAVLASDTDFATAGEIQPCGVFM